MKRAITSIASAALVLGTAIPMAFAATTTTPAYTKVGTAAFSYDGTTVTNPYILDSADGATASTAFAPVYYFSQLLAKAGITATWNGSTKTWALTDSSLTAAQVSTIAAAIAGGVGTGNTTITLNGTTIKMINTFAAQDPAGVKGDVTTYFPAYYVNNIFAAAGFSAAWNGTNMTLAVTSSVASASLSAITQTGATVGTGTQASPATALNGGTLTLSTTLTDASGNPVSGTQVTFLVNDGSGNAPTNVSATSNGQALAIGSSGSNATFEAYTNAAGVATIVLSGAAGETNAYTVQAQAPYQVNGSTLTSSTFYTEFVASGQVGISPYTGSGVYTGSLGTAVPVTITLPTANGAIQSNVAVNFSLANGENNTDSTVDGFFTNASGADLGATATVYTNSAGQATVYVNSSVVAKELTVSASSTTAYNPFSDVATNVEFQEAGTAQSISNLNFTSTSANAGSQVTISGTVVDAMGNPVPNAQLLLTGTYNENNPAAASDDAYVSGTTNTDFPDVTVATGVPATSTYGDVITANALGQFSAVVTDSNADSTPDNYYLYPVQNGVVSGTALNASSTNAVTWEGSSTLSAITTYASLPGSVASTDATSVTGIQVPESTNATVYFAPVSSSQPLTEQTFTYNLSASNGGDIESIDGASLLNAVSATTVTVSYNGGVYTLSVPGGFTDGTNDANTVTLGSFDETGYNSGTFDENYPLSGDPELLAVAAQNGTVGNTVLTATNGSINATATLNVTGGVADGLTSVSPVSGYVSSGGSETVSFEVEDSAGNPVANTSVPVELSGSVAPLWITQVNSIDMTQTEAISDGVASEPTPIPLYAAGTDYSTVVNPGVISATGVGTANPTINVYTNASGQVSLTIQDGNVPYYTSAAPYVTASSTVGADTGSSTSGVSYIGWANNAIQLGSSSTGSDGQFTYAYTNDSATYPTSATLSVDNANITEGTGGTATPTASVVNAEDQAVTGANATGTYTLTPAPGALATTDYTFNSTTGALTITSGSTVTGAYEIHYTNSANSSVTASTTVNVAGA